MEANSFRNGCVDQGLQCVVPDVLQNLAPPPIIRACGSLYERWKPDIHHFPINLAVRHRGTWSTWPEITSWEGRLPGRCRFLRTTKIDLAVPRFMLDQAFAALPDA